MAICPFRLCHITKMSSLFFENGQFTIGSRGINYFEILMTKNISLDWSGHPDSNDVKTSHNISKLGSWIKYTSSQLNSGQTLTRFIKNSQTNSYQSENVSFAHFVSELALQKKRLTRLGIDEVKPWQNDKTLLVDFVFKMTMIPILKVIGCLTFSRISLIWTKLILKLYFF